MVELLYGNGSVVAWLAAGVLGTFAGALALVALVVLGCAWRWLRGEEVW